MEVNSEVERKISEIEAELSALDFRRSQLIEELARIRQQLVQTSPPSQFTLRQQNSSVNNQSSQEDKVRPFRSLFRGRDDVFPRRFENRKTGKSGYAPGCQNEWAAGICQKPKIACQECNFQAFVPVSDEVIRNHLRGNDPIEYVKGFYDRRLSSTIR